jgi:hypothetical protein
MGGEEGVSGDGCVFPGGIAIPPTKEIVIAHPKTFRDRWGFMVSGVLFYSTVVSPMVKEVHSSDTLVSNNSLTKYTSAFRGLSTRSANIFFSNSSSS